MDFLVGLGEERNLVAGIIALAQWEITPEHLRSGDPNGAFIIYQQIAPGVRGAPVFFRPVRKDPPAA